MDTRVDNDYEYFLYSLVNEIDTNIIVNGGA